MFFQSKMALFNPIIFEDYQEFHTASSNSNNNDFFVGPYEFSTKNFKKPKNSVLLFDLPVEIIVSFDSVTISGSCFDYFNPLLVNANILKKIKFINKNDSSVVNSFNCNILTSKILGSLNDIILNSLVFYPPAHSIEYKSVNASRSGYGKQICDILLKPVPDLTGIHPPVPMMNRPRYDHINPGLPPVPMILGMRPEGFHPVILPHNQIYPGLPMPHPEMHPHFISDNMIDINSEQLAAVLRNMFIPSRFDPDDDY
jgi:hypothetical protein